MSVCCKPAKFASALFDTSCIKFTVSVMFSVAIMAISILGLCGVFKFGNDCYWTSLLTLIVGLYMKLPSISKKSADADKEENTIHEKI